MIIDGNFNADRLIEFLEALIKDSTKKALLILDNLRADHSKPVKDCLAERTDRIEVFYLPSYARELNPDERLNADMKHAFGAKIPVRTKPRLKAAAEEHMAMIGNSSDRVRAYFHDPSSMPHRHFKGPESIGVALPTGIASTTGFPPPLATSCGASLSKSSNTARFRRRRSQR
jgi:transposase